MIPPVLVEGKEVNPPPALKEFPGEEKELVVLNDGEKLVEGYTEEVVWKGLEELVVKVWLG